MTFIEAVDTLMPTFDPEIRRIAERILIKNRACDFRTGVFAAEVTPGIPGQKPVTIKMIDAKTKELVETLEVDACMVATGNDESSMSTIIYFIDSCSSVDIAHFPNFLC